MIIAAIVATDLNNAIGKDNKLLWHMPADLKFFKTMTLGCPVVMGRKTYESMGRILPGRKNLIVTRNHHYKVEGAEVYQSVEAAVKSCAGEMENRPEKVFIIGGAEIFKQTFPLTDEVYRTLVKAEFEADTFIPEISDYAFEMVWEECHQADEKNKYEYCFQKWKNTSKKPD